MSMSGQTGTGSIQATVKDTTGAAIPDAAVTALHNETSRKYETRTNHVGFFLLPALQTGAYTVSVAAPGMETWKGSMLLQVGQAAVIEPVLRVGASATEIVVTADATPLVTTTIGTLQSVLERERIEQLPLNGRFVQTLIQATTPGLESNAYDPRVFGLRGNSMEFSQDGAVLNNRNSGGITGRPPGIDTIQEFRVETINASARNSRPASTIMSTKSGTNKVHGSLFETARNNGLGVARGREDFYDKPPHLVRNEFGASLGAPVYLPKLYNGRNRTFFFFAWEAYRNMAANTSSVSMPTMAMRQGDFSGLIDATGRARTLYDPWSTDSRTWVRQPYPNNRIPMARQSPLAKYLYSVTPEPTMPDVNPMVRANYFGLGIDNRRDDTETLRIDHRLSNADQLFGRYSHGGRASGSRTSDSPILLDGASNITNRRFQDDSGVLSWTHTFSPTLFGETIFTGSREAQAWLGGMDDVNMAERLGLPNPFKATGLPQFTSTGFDMVYDPVSNRNDNTLIFMVDQNFTKVFGRHEFMFGGRFRNEMLDVLPDQQFVQGAHNFSSLATALYDPKSGSSYAATPNTGHDSANLFLGIVGQYQVRFARGWYNLTSREFSGYFQDNFKVTPRLSLNLGVRYEFYPAIRERNNALTGFDPKRKMLVSGIPIENMYKLGLTTPAIVKTFTDRDVRFESPEQAGLPGRLIYSNPRDFWPRIGFAYRLSSGRRSTVVRGGFSVFGSQIPLRTFNARMRSNAPFTSRFQVNVNNSAQSPDGLPNYRLRSVPTVVAGVNSANVIDPDSPAAITRGSFVTSFFNPEQPTTRAAQWNVTLEREVMANTLLRAGYVGTHGSRLDQFWSFNDAPSAYVWYATTGLPTPKGEYSGVAMRGFESTTYGVIEEYMKTGWSNYNGVQVELQKRYSRGYAFQLFYVMGNAFRAGGNGWSDDYVYEPNIYMPGAVPTGFNQRNRFLNYQRDPDIAKHRLRWNWIIDLPFGRNHKFLDKAGPWLNRLVGGWQIAGFGNRSSRYWALPTTNYITGNIEIYGTKYPVQDCRSGSCVAGYLYYNGYIPANRRNSYDAQGRPNGVMGVPSNYKPSHQPLISTPANDGAANDPNRPYYDSNTVYVPMKDGTLQRTTFDNGLNPWRNQFVSGPALWSLDASLFKNVRVNERVNLRFNADFFNVMNMPGLTLPASATGILSLENSAQAARQLQLTVRVQW